MTTRSPICVVVGHVDHGKSSVLDAIRGTAIVATEAGKITQAIGASIIPLKTIQKVCGNLLESLKMKFTIPGLLFVDTPGHAAFTSLRKRGGSIADIAILVVDINEGFKPQTIESIEILKKSKTPFILAANKVDLVPGWTSKHKNIIQTIGEQHPGVVEQVETKLYEIVGNLHQYGFPSERFDRVDDYTKQIAIIPISAHTKEGFPELLMVLTGLAQKYLESSLKTNVSGPAKGTVLEVKEEKGLGTTIDVIIYDGKLQKNDTIVIGGIEQPVVTKVRALLEPKPLAEMRDKKTKYNQMQSVSAATGVKISAPELKGVIAGMPLRSSDAKNLSATKKEVQSAVEEVLIDTDGEGVVIKADTIGGLEALARLLKDKNIPIHKASIGDISKKDLIEAESNFESHPLLSCVLGFNVKSEVKSSNVKVFTHPVIYQIIDDYEDWKSKEVKKSESAILAGLVKPCKMQLMPGYVFRQCNPAVCGTEILYGTLKTGVSIMSNDGKHLGSVKEIQEEKKNITEVEQGKQVAVSYDGFTIGRQALEGDYLYTEIPEDEFRKLKDNKHLLNKAQLQVMKEIAEIKRAGNPVWGV